MAISVTTGLPAISWPSANVSFDAAFLKASLSWYGTFDHILDSGPHYIVSGAFLLLTIIIEMPIVYNVLKSNVQSKRMLQITIIVSNIITTAGVAVIERLITEGHW